MTREEASVEALEEKLDVGDKRPDLKHCDLALSGIHRLKSVGEYGMVRS